MKENTNQQTVEAVKERERELLAKEKNIFHYQKRMDFSKEAENRDLLLKSLSFLRAFKKEIYLKLIGKKDKFAWKNYAYKWIVNMRFTI